MKQNKIKRENKSVYSVSEITFATRAKKTQKKQLEAEKARNEMIKFQKKPTSVGCSLKQLISIVAL